MVKKTVIGALAIIIAATLWGVDGVVLRPMLYHLDVASVVLLEHLAGLLVISWLFYTQREQLKKIPKSVYGSFIWIAVFGGAIGTMAITKALFYVNFEQLSVIVILQKLQPLFAIALAMVVLKERPKPGFFLWAGLALLGSYLITFGFKLPVFAGNRLFIAGMLSMLAAFSFGSSTVFGRKALNQTDFKTATLLRFAVTTVVMVIIIGLWSAFSLNNRFALLFDAGLKEVLVLFGIALTTGATAIFIYYFGLNRIKASKATIYELAFPISAVLLDYSLHGTVLGAGQWLGAGILVASMMMITK